MLMRWETRKEVLKNIGIWCVNIPNSKVALFGYGTARVFSLYPIVGSFEISAIAGFVAQRPENDAGMIEATLHIALVTLHMCFPIVLTFGKCLFPITHSVGFDIGFGHYVNTILVAEVVPEIIVGIVAGYSCRQR